MYTEALISTIVTTTATAWSFCTSALNICFTDTLSTLTVDFSFILTQVIRIDTKNNIEIISANHLNPVYSFPFPRR